MLRKFQINPNAYYNYLKHRKQEQKQRIDHMKSEITTRFHKHNGTVGYRMLGKLLRMDGHVICDATVYKYMADLGLKATIRRRKKAYVKGYQHKVFENLIDRDFKSDLPNTKWCTDFTYMKLANGTFRYNCSIIDLYDRKVVATLNSHKIDTNLAIDTLNIAVENNSVPKGLILHSDQGSQFCSKAFVKRCNDLKIKQSMSRAGCPGDNAVMERFYGTFKLELINIFHFYTEEELDEAVEDYVYDWYNYRRPHTYNNDLPPFYARYAA